MYIDPPYNTGEQTWEYNDNVASPIMQQWLTEKPSFRSTRKTAAIARFILVECEDYAEKLTAERVRRVING